MILRVISDEHKPPPPKKKHRHLATTSRLLQIVPARLRTDAFRVSEVSGFAQPTVFMKSMSFSRTAWTFLANRGRGRGFLTIIRKAQNGKGFFNQKRWGFATKKQGRFPCDWCIYQSIQLSVSYLPIHECLIVVKKM